MIRKLSLIMAVAAALAFPSAALAWNGHGGGHHGGGHGGGHWGGHHGGHWGGHGGWGGHRGGCWRWWYGQWHWVC
ncbi:MULTISPECIES: hypothetical protein [Methylocystis]|uniref:hypothetical protein n=1 Tax=Methylocystis TaxID=133 RepID=UPI00210E6091|nr:hypothetical protein [Methylocystis suflitae]MCQ4191064.1 hypothetical protein [Methylocystis suflitae]